MPKSEPLRHGGSYHIYNRGVNREHLFVEERNYRYVLQLYARHVEPIAETHAYCLLRNHLQYTYDQDF
jgi:putative transposase